VGAPHVAPCRTSSFLLVHDVPDRGADRNPVLQLDRPPCGGASCRSDADDVLGRVLITFLLGGRTGVAGQPAAGLPRHRQLVVSRPSTTCMFGTSCSPLFAGTLWLPDDGRLLASDWARLQFWLTLSVSHDVHDSALAAVDIGMQPSHADLPAHRTDSSLPLRFTTARSSLACDDSVRLERLQEIGDRRNGHRFDDRGDTALVEWGHQLPTAAAQLHRAARIRA